MKVRFLLAVVTIIGSLTGWAVEEKKDAELLQGTWRPESARLGDAELPNESLKTMLLIVDGSNYTVHLGEAVDKGTVSIDPKKKPREMDISGTAGPNEGKKFLAIYEVTSDELKICYSLDGKTRPSEFKTKGDKNLFLVSYKRKKS